MTVEYNVGGVIVVFLLVIVLVLQVQLNSLNKKIEEIEGKINKKVDELLKQKNNPIAQTTILNSSHPQKI